MSPTVCRPDSSGANWFMCSRGTVGCPICHDGLTPHCIECTDPSLTCRYGHEPPAVEMTVEEHCEIHPDQREHLMGATR